MTMLDTFFAIIKQSELGLARLGKGNVIEADNAFTQIHNLVLQGHELADDYYEDIARRERNA